MFGDYMQREIDAEIVLQKALNFAGGAGRVEDCR